MFCEMPTDVTNCVTYPLRFLFLQTIVFILFRFQTDSMASCTIQLFLVGNLILFNKVSLVLFFFQYYQFLTFDILIVSLSLNKHLDIILFLSISKYSIHSLE